MIDSKELLEHFNTEEIVNLLNEFGSPIYDRGTTSDGEEFLTFRTVCHCGQSHKLYFYTTSKKFYCYTNCGSMSLYDLVGRVKRCEFKDSFNFLAKRAGVNLNSDREGIQSGMTKENKGFINLLERKKERKQNHSSVSNITHFYNPNVLNYFDANTFYQGWIDEGITIDTMRKYNIRYYYLNSHIIIPHYNIDNQLVGIRRRSLRPDEAKYMPENLEGVEYDHRLALNLYGLNLNKDAIRRQKKAVIVEGEKSVMMGDSFYGDDNILVGACGFNVHDWQVKALKQLGVQKVYLGFDKDFDLTRQDKYKTDKDKELLQRYKDSMNKFINRLNNKFEVHVILDTEGLLGYKDSPTDKGKEVFEQLLASAKIKQINKDIQELC